MDSDGRVAMQRGSFRAAPHLRQSAPRRPSASLLLRRSVLNGFYLLVEGHLVEASPEESAALTHSNGGERDCGNISESAGWGREEKRSRGGMPPGSRCVPGVSPPCGHS